MGGERRVRPLQSMPVTRPLARAAWILALLALVAVVAPVAALAPRAALATPLYSARAGRTCDNCHLRPNLWKNPAVLDRKCTLSCRSCHVDPAGGGMRNASGRFYGRATLPTIASSPRPTQDWNSWIGGLLYRRDKATTFTDSLPEGPPDHAASRDARYAPRERLSYGRPAGAPSKWAYFPGRYGDVNADPVFRVSWDARVALLVSQGALFFPMQADAAAAFHPVEHLTFLGTVGARGRSGGFSETTDDPSTPYLRDGFLLLHELPAGAHLKAGRFVPQFGLRLDDHTAQTRRTFEQDGSVPEARVAGVEVGVNPNYPFVNASWFRSVSRTRAPDAFDLFDMDRGHGFALNAGYRELGWSLGGSALLHRRPVAEGGDATGFALFGSFNPWYYRRRLPLTYQFEYDTGRFQRESGLESDRRAFYHELDWRAGNGVNLLVAQDWADPDTEVKDDHAFRISAGVQVTPIQGLTLDLRARGLFPASGDAGADLFTQVHFWR